MSNTLKAAPNPLVLAWRSELERYAVSVGPLIECPGGELRTLRGLRVLKWWNREE